MTTDDFNNIFNDTIAASRNTLVKKASEYATDDRLHNFKVAAQIEGCTPIQALGGMMAKHTVSVYDLIRNGVESATLGMWDEKIGDSINYLILLRALVIEENEKKLKAEANDMVRFADDMPMVHVSL